MSDAEPDDLGAHEEYSEVWPAKIDTKPPWLWLERHVFVEMANESTDDRLQIIAAEAAGLVEDVETQLSAPAPQGLTAAAYGQWRYRAGKVLAVVKHRQRVVDVLISARLKERRRWLQEEEARERREALSRIGTKDERRRIAREEHLARGEAIEVAWGLLIDGKLREAMETVLRLLADDMRGIVDRTQTVEYRARCLHEGTRLAAEGDVAGALSQIVLYLRARHDAYNKVRT